MTDDWYWFGKSLGLSNTDLNIIKGQKNGLRYLIMTVLDEWIKVMGKEATWEALQQALISIGNRRLAAKLEEHKQRDKKKAG